MAEKNPTNGRPLIVMFDEIQLLYRL